MTVITYSNSERRLQNKIPVLEHPSTCGNVPEPMYEILEPGTMLDSLKIQEYYGVKHTKMSKEKSDIKEQSIKFQTMGQGINSYRKDVKGYLKLVNGENKNEPNLTWMCSFGKNGSGILQREKMVQNELVFALTHQSIHEEKYKMNFFRLKWHKVCLWLLMFLSLYPKPASSQGHFPRMENIAAFKPVSTSPLRSTCGVPEQSSYCQLPSSQDELHLCFQFMCVQECPYRSSTPPYAPLLLAAHRSTCVTEDTVDTHPGTQTEAGSKTSSDGLSAGPDSILFQPSRDGCLVTPPSQAIGPRGSLTLAVWLKPSSTGEM
ncbi:hypothetical protein CRENBAI_019064 [Crenichthys baileyi]|uniref:Uncharacterized protein n=1 Tax=Crenichthys baileyi TaxID=28760 RepID=A0AAV9RIM1_9TELE